MEKSQDSFKSTFKKIKSQIQKGANPEKAAKCGHKNAYFEILNKRIIIQQSFSLPEQILSPDSPEEAVYHGQHWLAKT